MAGAIETSKASPWRGGRRRGEVEAPGRGRGRAGVRRPPPTPDVRGLSGGGDKQNVNGPGKSYGPQATRCEAFVREKIIFRRVILHDNRERRPAAVMLLIGSRSHVTITAVSTCCRGINPSSITIWYTQSAFRRLREITGNCSVGDGLY